MRKTVWYPRKYIHIFFLHFKRQLLNIALFTYFLMMILQIFPFLFFSCLKGCRKLNLAANAYEEIQNTTRIDLEKHYKFRHFDFTLVKTSDVDLLKALIINSMLKNRWSNWNFSVMRLTNVRQWFFLGSNRNVKT